MNKDTTIKFCQKCSASTLQRVSIWLDQRGKIKYKLCQRRRFCLRGTIHPIPNPKTGRNAKKYIQSEDVYKEELRKALRKGRRQKGRGDEGEFGVARFNVMDLPKIGAGRKNPNKSRGRRRRKKH